MGIFGKKVKFTPPLAPIQRVRNGFLNSTENSDSDRPYENFATEHVNKSLLAEGLIEKVSFGQ